MNFNTKKEIKALCIISLLFATFLVSQERSESVKLPEPVNLMGVKSNYPFITRDGSRLYFCSDRGLGAAEDIFYCDRNEDIMTTNSMQTVVVFMSITAVPFTIGPIP